MRPLNQHLLKTIVLSWLSFGVVGLVMRQVVSAPSIVVLIDRSYCSATGWQQLTQTYAELYHQHQQQQLRIDQVILFSDLGQESFSVPPIPTTIGMSNTYGRPASQRREQLKQQYPQARLLMCP